MGQRNDLKMHQVILRHTHINLLTKEDRVDLPQPLHVRKNINKAIYFFFLLGEIFKRSVY